MSLYRKIIPQCFMESRGKLIGAGLLGAAGLAATGVGASAIKSAADDIGAGRAAKAARAAVVDDQMAKFDRADQATQARFRQNYGTQSQPATTQPRPTGTQPMAIGAAKGAGQWAKENPYAATAAAGGLGYMAARARQNRS